MVDFFNEGNDMAMKGIIRKMSVRIATAVEKCEGYFEISTYDPAYELMRDVCSKDERFTLEELEEKVGGFTVTRIHFKKKDNKLPESIVDEISIPSMLREVNDELSSPEEIERVRANIKSYMIKAVREDQDYICLSVGDHRIGIQSGVIEKGWYSEDRGSIGFNVYFRNTDKAIKRIKRSNLIENTFLITAGVCISTLVVLMAIN